MAGATIDLKIIAELIDKATPGIKQLTESMKGMEKTLKAVSDQNAALVERLGRATQARGRHRQAVEQETRSTGLLSAALGNSRVRYEALVLTHEAMMGSFKRLAGSSIVMAENLVNVGAASGKALLGIGAVAGAIALFVLHVVHVNQLTESFNKLKETMAGVGNAGQLGTAQIAANIDKLRLFSGISKQDAIDILSAFASIPQLAGPQIERLTKIVAAFSEVTGKNAAEAAKTLGEAIAHPVEGAKKLDQQLNILSAGELEQIEKLVRMGKTAEAQEILFGKLQTRLGDLHQKSLTPLNKALEDFYKTWQEVAGGIGGPEGEATWLNGAKFVEAFRKTLIGLKADFAVLRHPIEAFTNPNFVDEFVLGKPKAADQQVKSGPLLSGLLKDTAAQKAAKDAIIAKTKAEQDSTKATLLANAGYKTQAELVEENRQRLTALNAVINSKNTSAADRALAIRERAGVLEQMTKEKGLVNEIAQQQGRLAQAKREEAGYTDTLSESEKTLIDIEQHKYDKYPEQVKRLKLLAQETVEIEKQNKALKEVQGIMSDLATLDEGSFNRATKTVSQLDEINRKVVEASKNRKDAGIQQFADLVRQDLIANQTQLNQQALTKTEKDLTAAVNQQLSAIDQQNQKYLLTSTQLRDLNEVEAIRLKYENAINDLSPTLLDYEAERARLIQLQADALKDVAAKQAERAAFEADWTNGAKKALNELKETSLNVADLTYNAFKSGFGSISDVFQNFMKTGKFSFQSLGDSFLDMINKMVADALAARLMNALFGNFNSTGTIGGTGGDIAGFLSSIFGGGRASGGPVQAGHAYVVGEKRPELFVPNMSGTIIPQVGTTQTNVNINIQSLDGADTMRVLHKYRREISNMVSGSQTAYNLR